MAQVTFSHIIISSFPLYSHWLSVHCSWLNILPVITYQKQRMTFQTFCLMFSSSGWVANLKHRYKVTCVPYVLSKSLLNMDTRIIQTLWHVPLVSIFTGFHCILYAFKAASRVNVIRMESIRKLISFNFQWTKTLYQNNFKHIAVFFTFFNGYRCN